jgi:hypothetical protein
MLCVNPPLAARHGRGTAWARHAMCESAFRNQISHTFTYELSRGVLMIHDNVHPLTAAATQNLITTFGWQQFHHPPYSPELAPSDFHFFGLISNLMHYILVYSYIIHLLNSFTCFEH